MTNDYVLVNDAENSLIVKVEHGSHYEKFNDENTSVVDINSAGNDDEFIWENWSSLIFPGFYGTIIGEENWLQDIIDRNREDATEYEDCGEEIPDYCYQTFEAVDSVIDKTPGFYMAYENHVANYYTELLWDEVVHRKLNNVITVMKYDHLWSPREYNFYTDRLNIRMKCNWDEMEKFIHNHMDEFEKYIKDNWTSRSGFCSFVPNTFEKLRGHSAYREICIEFLLYRIAFEDSERDEYLDSIEYAVYEHLGEVSIEDVIWWASKEKSLQESAS